MAASELPAGYTGPTMIDFTPNPVALALGPLEIRWYGIAYVAAILAGPWLAIREARRRGERTDILIDGLIVVAVAALIGGRAYHVIDQWAYYKDHLAQIFLPPYSGLGIYGGLFTGMLAVDLADPPLQSHLLALGRHHRAVHPDRAGGRPVGQLHEPGAVRPADEPAVGHRHPVPVPRGASTPVRPGRPDATPSQHFIPLFFYESMLSLIGVFVMILLWRHFTARGRLLIAGDVGLLYFVWYGLERSLLETFRSG